MNKTEQRPLLTKQSLQEAIKAFIVLSNILKVSPGGYATGEIGEQYARLYYDVNLVKNRSEKAIDAYTKDGKTVQIKTHSFTSDRTTINFPTEKVDYVLIFYIKENGEIEEIYNGSWELINKNFKLKSMQNTTVCALTRSKIKKLNPKSIPLRYGD